MSGALAHWALLHSEASTPARAVLAAYALTSGPDGWPIDRRRDLSRDDLMEITGLKDRTIGKARLELLEHGELVQVYPPGGRGRYGRYRVAIRPERCTRPGCWACDRLLPHLRPDTAHEVPGFEPPEDAEGETAHETRGLDRNRARGAENRASGATPNGDGPPSGGTAPSLTSGSPARPGGRSAEPEPGSGKIGLTPGSRAAIEAAKDELAAKRRERLGVPSPPLEPSPGRRPATQEAEPGGGGGQEAAEAHPLGLRRPPGMEPEAWALELAEAARLGQPEPWAAGCRMGMPFTCSEVGCFHEDEGGCDVPVGLGLVLTS